MPEKSQTFKSIRFSDFYFFRIFTALLTPIYICGPTASGKSSLAIQLAQQYNGEVINADAYQIYAGLETITAAPSSDEKEIIPHHLYGIIPPNQNCDAGKFLSLARPVIADVQSRGKTPIITGGSGLYLKFLTHGPSPLPQADSELRATFSNKTTEQLFTQLRQLDHAEATRLGPHNRRYIERALEICILTNQTASSQRQDWQRVPENLHGILLDPPRDELHARITQRTEKMLAGGAIDEISNIKEFSATASKAIGVSQILAHLKGDINLTTCCEQIIIATRQYAKRQSTWFRRESWLRKLATSS